MNMSEDTTGERISRLRPTFQFHFEVKGDCIVSAVRKVSETFIYLGFKPTFCNWCTVILYYTVSKYFVIKKKKTVAHSFSSVHITYTNHLNEPLGLILKPRRYDNKQLYSFCWVLLVKATVLWKCCHNTDWIRWLTRYLKCKPGH